MKYLVELSYTNPSHEHISLRRRVERVTRLVEATSEEQAILRASQQQRALGFFIKEAKVLNNEQKEVAAAPAVLKEELEQVDESKIAGVLGAMADVQRRREEKQQARRKKELETQLSKLAPDDHGGRYLIGRKLDKMKAMKEEVEQIDEAKQKKTVFNSKDGKRRVVVYSDGPEDHYIHHQSKVKGGWNTDQDEVSRKPLEHLSNKYKKQLYAEELEQIDEIDYKKYLDASKARKTSSSAIDAAVASYEKGDPNPLRKIRNTRDARRFAQSQLNKKFNVSQPARPFPVYEPGRRYVGDSVELDGPMIDSSNELEQVDEANMRFDPEAAARPKSSDVKNFLNRDVNRRAGAASKKYIRRMTKLGGLGPNQTKKDTEAHMKAHFEEVEQVNEAEREAGYKMPQHIAAAQKKFDAQTAAQNKKPIQAGTLAAQRARMQQNMQQKEAADPGSMKVVNKKVKAADKMIKAAKGKKSDVNLEPTLELTKTI